MEPKFDPTEYYEKFDEDNPEVDIPSDVSEEFNNDWVIEED